MAKRTLADRLWAKVDKTGSVPEHRPGLGPCWLWTGWCHIEGYGLLKVDRKNKRVHVLAYELVVGSVPAGLELDHLCHDHTTCTLGNACPHRRCCNPMHLEAVTHLENMRRAGQALQPDCAYGHPLDGVFKKGKQAGTRYCKTCCRQREARRHLAKV
jgi:hypothetical protein